MDGRLAENCSPCYSDSGWHDGLWMIVNQRASLDRRASYSIIGDAQFDHTCFNMLTYSKLYYLTEVFLNYLSTLRPVA